MNWGSIETTEAKASPPIHKPQTVVEQRRPSTGKGTSGKQTGIFFLVIIIIFAFIVLLSWYPLSSTPPTTTVKIAVYNDCENDVVDVEVYVDGLLKRHIPIYNGYWADFGTYSVVKGKNVRIETTPEYSSTKIKRVVASTNQNVAIMVNENKIETVSYPAVTLEPSRAPFSPKTEPDSSPEVPTGPKPTSIHVQVEYERKDWATTNVGEVDHFVYGFTLDSWADGTLTLTLKDSGGRTVKTVKRSFTRADIEAGDIEYGFITKSYVIYVSGSPYNVKSFSSTYVMSGGGTLTDSGTISEPY
jgi:hypothetical protein